MKYTKIGHGEIRVDLGLGSTIPRYSHPMPSLRWSSRIVFGQIDDFPCAYCKELREKIYSCPLFYKTKNDHQDGLKINLIFYNGIIDPCFCICFYKFFRQFITSWHGHHSRKIVLLSFQLIQQIICPDFFYSLLLFVIVTRPHILGDGYFLDLCYSVNFKDLFVIPNGIHKYTRQHGTFRIRANSSLDFLQMTQYLLKISFKNICVIHETNEIYQFDERKGLEITIWVNRVKKTRIILDPLFIIGCPLFVDILCDKIGKSVLCFGGEVNYTIEKISHVLPRHWHIRCWSTITSALSSRPKRNVRINNVKNTPTPPQLPVIHEESEWVKQYTSFMKNIQCYEDNEIRKQMIIDEIKYQ